MHPVRIKRTLFFPHPLPAATTHPLRHQVTDIKAVTVQSRLNKATRNIQPQSNVKLTVKEALDLQVPDAEAEHGQLVQPGPDLLGEGQQAGELVQLPIEPVSVAFGGVGLGSIGRRWLGAVGTKIISIYSNTEESKHQGKLVHLVPGLPPTSSIRV